MCGSAIDHVRPLCFTFLFSCILPLRSCLVPPSFTQTTLTGSDWRSAVAYWPAMVAGMFDRRHDASVAPF